jgi:hypothetical protein
MPAVTLLPLTALNPASIKGLWVDQTGSPANVSLVIDPVPTNNLLRITHPFHITVKEVLENNYSDALISEDYPSVLSGTRDVQHPGAKRILAKRTNPLAPGLGAPLIHVGPKERTEVIQLREGDYGSSYVSIWRAVSPGYPEGIVLYYSRSGDKGLSNTQTLLYPHQRLG